MTVLPELPVYVICWAVAAFTSVASVFVSSMRLQHSLRINDYLEPGWLWPNFLKDYLDLEWEDFKRALFYDLRWWFLGHIIGSLFMRILGIISKSRVHSMKNIFFCIYGMLYANCVLGGPCTILMIFEILSMFIISKLFRTVTSMWITSFVWIAVVQCFLISRFSLADDYHKSLQFSSLAYTLLRSLYFANYIISSKKKSINIREGCINKEDFVKESQVTLLDCLTYCFYMPLLTFGQLTVFEQFKLQINGDTKLDKKYLFKRIIRILIWTIFYEILVHLCYPFALLYEETLLWGVSLWTLAGTAYLITQLFTVKYVVLWSYTSFVAGVDGIDTPTLPECTSHCHQSSIIWRTFDNGLYGFIKRNIYVAMGGSRRGLKQQLIASFSSFLFLCLWHGLNSRILLWCLTSYASLVLEVLTFHMFAKYHSKLNACISDDAILRIKYVFLTLNLALFLFGTLVFLGNINLCHAMYYRLFVESFPVSLLIYLFCTYSGLHAGRAWKEFKMSQLNEKQS